MSDSALKSFIRKDGTFFASERKKTRTSEGAPTGREFDGCMSHGDTYEEAFENIQDAMKGWIETKLENGFSVPDPIDDNSYSGKFVLRVPKSLHARLAFEAEQEGVSLNQYALYRLSR